MKNTNANQRAAEGLQIPTLACQRCGHTWVPRVSRVTKCPACKSALWDIPRGNRTTKKCLASGKKGGVR